MVDAATNPHARDLFMRDCSSGNFFCCRMKSDGL
jgi:hypothetical protein